MKAIFHKCYDDWGNLKDNALNIAFNLGKKEGLRKGKKIAKAEVIEDARKICGAEYPNYIDCANCLFAHFKNDFDITICKLEQLKEQNK